VSIHDRPSEDVTIDVDRDGQELTFVELTGKDRGRWSIHRNRFFQRISKAAAEAFRRLANANGPRGRTLSEEVRLFLDVGLSSCQALLERPILGNMKRKVEIERIEVELQTLRASASNRDPIHEDAVGEARSRKIAYDVLLELLAAGKVFPVNDGDSLTLLVHDLSEADMKAFAKVKGYQPPQGEGSETPEN